MKRLSQIALVILAVALFVPVPLWAKTETQAILSQKCPKEKLKDLGGKAIVSIEKENWEGGYRVTLDTDKMSFNELLQKMAKASCN